MKLEIVFTHYWITGFGWENTVFEPKDFLIVEQLGETENKEIVFIGFNASNTRHILKGYYTNKK